jgi:hypothetical protein
MNNFIFKILKFNLIFVLVLFIVIYLDFFKVFWKDDFYGENQAVVLNREMITTRTYIKNRKSQNYNSFIFGSSRSLAFKTSEFKKYIDPESNVFHFDASWESLVGVYEKLKLIDKLNDSIKNVLIIIDEDILTQTRRQHRHLYVPLPYVASISWLEYYWISVQSSLNPMFLVSIIDYTFSKEYKNYMGQYIQHLEKYKYKGDPINCDQYWPHDSLIYYDSANYYRERIRRGVFYPRKKTNRFKQINNDTRLYLTKIHNILLKNKSKFKIVVAPNYDQIPIQIEYKTMLNTIFGPVNIFDFSGKNTYTDSISNYYESSHFRPIVAKEIIREIYMDK